jgi:hypothetical protein
MGYLNRASICTDAPCTSIEGGPATCECLYCTYARGPGTFLTVSLNRPGVWRNSPTETQKLARLRLVDTHLWNIWNDVSGKPLADANST